MSKQKITKNQELLFYVLPKITNHKTIAIVIENSKKRTHKAVDMIYQAIFLSKEWTAKQIFEDIQKEIRKDIPYGINSYDLTKLKIKWCKKNET